MEKVNVIENSMDISVNNANIDVQPRIIGAGCGIICLGAVCATGLVC